MRSRTSSAIVFAVLAASARRLQPVQRHAVACGLSSRRGLRSPSRRSIPIARLDAPPHFGETVAICSRAGS